MVITASLFLCLIAVFQRQIQLLYAPFQVCVTLLQHQAAAVFSECLVTIAANETHGPGISGNLRNQNEKLLSAGPDLIRKSHGVGERGIGDLCALLQSFDSGSKILFDHGVISTFAFFLV